MDDENYEQWSLIFTCVERDSFMYNEFVKWLDKILDKNIPLPGIALNFNLYEDDDSQWSIQIISSAEFDEEDPDWCCDEMFSSGEDLFT